MIDLIDLRMRDPDGVPVNPTLVNVMERLTKRDPRGSNDQGFDQGDSAGHDQDGSEHNGHGSSVRQQFAQALDTNGRGEPQTG
jgi:hypothetical protein